MTGRSKGAVLKLLADIGEACSEYQARTLRGLKCIRVQCDEIWSFCYAKQKNAPDPLKGVYGIGDVRTWTALCADTKLIPSWRVGSRDAETAKDFIDDLAKRLTLQFQLSTDGNNTYLEAVENAFGGAVSYAQLVKIYGEAPGNRHETRYSSGDCIGTDIRVISGNPKTEHVSTSFVERQDLTLRMSMRRFTRLTNAFSKKAENHAHAVALHLMHYNFGRVHKSLNGRTPAMAAGVADHVWTAEEIAGLLDSK